MKKLIITILTIFMFFFKNSSLANYDKVFYDFSIENIDGELIDLKKYKNN